MLSLPIQEVGVRLRSEPQQQSEADKTKVTFTTTKKEEEKAKVKHKLKFMCKKNIIDLFSDRACSETTSTIHNRLDSSICGGSKNLVKPFRNFKWECAMIDRSRWLEAPAWGSHQTPCQGSPMISGWHKTIFLATPHSWMDPFCQD